MWPQKWSVIFGGNFAYNLSKYAAKLIHCEGYLIKT